MNINFAIIGFGSFAKRRLLPAINSIKKIKLFGIHNRSKSKAKKIAEENDINFHTNDEKKLLSHPKIDAIIITSPPHLHKKHLILCENRKIPIMCEKPFVLSFNDFLEVKKVYKNRNDLLIGQCYRFKNSLKIAKKYIKDRKIGKLLSMEFKMHIPLDKNNWRYQKKYGGGVLNDIGIHLIDIIHFLTGEKIISFKISNIIIKDNQNENVDVAVKANCLLEKNATFSFSISFIDPYDNSFAIKGSKGTLLGKYNLRQANDTKESLQFLDLKKNILDISLKNNDIYQEELKEFFSVITENKISQLCFLNMGLNYQILEKMQENVNN